MDHPGTEPELPRGTTRKHLRVHESVRAYLKAQTEGTGRTISQELNSYLPDNWDEVEFGYEDDDVAHMKVTPETKRRIVSMTGTNISQGDVTALFVFLGALRNGDIDAAQDIAISVPELIWDVMNEMSDSILKTKAN